MKTEYVRCNLCGSDSSHLLFKQRDLLVDVIAEEFPVVQCKNCGLVYVNPRPTFQEMGKFYPKNFISYQFELLDLNQQQSTIRKKIISSITRSIALSRIRDVAKHMKLDRSISTLDIGCGKGAFLYYLNKIHKCKCIGIDFDWGSVNYCKKKLGLNVLQGDVHLINEIKGEFDLITMWHFLEHEFDPLSAILSIIPHLKQEGLLVIEVPNQESLENKIFKKRSYLYDVPRHLYHFSPMTIGNLLKKVDLAIQRITFPPQSGGWLGTAQSILLRGKIYQDMQANAVTLCLLGAIIFPIDYIVSKTHFGSITRVFARKKRS